MGSMKDLLGDQPFQLPSPPAAQAFDGGTYNPGRDHDRLKGLLGKVNALMADGKWRTLSEIALATGGSEASVSARLRDFRKSKYGARGVERQHIGNGLYRYRLIPK